MKRDIVKGLTAGVALVLLLGACGPDADPTSTVEAATEKVTEERAADAVADASGDAQDSTSNGGSARSADVTTMPKDANRQGGDTTEGLPPLVLPWESEVPVSATVKPSCAERGEQVRLIVETKKKAGVAFQAVYSDNRGGAPKPLGGGYGGNDKGKTGTDGKLVRSWVIGAAAPDGEGRIDIIVGWNGKWGYLGEPFAVADASGACDVG